MIIEDGTGKGYSQKVDTNNQAHVFSASEPYQGFVSRVDKKAFVIATGFISLTTTASFSGMLYVKYTGDNLLRIEQLRVCGNAMSSSMKTKILLNPTAGTLISTASAAYSSNANFSSSNTFSGLAYTGADGLTVTDGSWFSQFMDHLPGHSIQSYNGGLILEKGNSLAILTQPGAAGDVCMELQCYVSTKDL